MAKSFSRRNFLQQTAKGCIAVGLSNGITASFAGTIKDGRSEAFLQTGFTQTPLTYAYNDLAPYIDALTMEIHYSKHAAAYAKNLNDAADAEQVNKNAPLENLMQQISKYSEKMRNNGGGHYNHELFWKLMQPGPAQMPETLLLKAITTQFGSIEAFKKEFVQTALNRFGSGWAWLVVDADKKLRIGSTPNQDNPLMDVSPFKGKPVLALDVWEHAYYLNYQNRRADYAASWWQVVNWNYANTLYQDALH